MAEQVEQALIPGEVSPVLGAKLLPGQEQRALADQEQLEIAGQEGARTRRMWSGLRG